MRLRQLKMLCASSAVSLAVLSLIAPAAHAAYGGDGGLTISPTSVHAGGSIKVESTGWKPSSSVTITLHSDPVVLDTVTSDASGNVSATATIPAGTDAGAHTIVATGSGTSGSPQELTSNLTVMAASGGGGGSLPRTGAAVAALAMVGLALFGGGALMSAARKRATR
jgi:LPXTG-motif cell wall-anchored protein